MTQGTSNLVQYRANWPALCPPWLTEGNAELYMYTLQQMTDLLVDKMNQAIQFRLPGLGDPTQLPYLANDRALVQGPAELDSSFVGRLNGYGVAWGKCGSRVAVLEQLQAYLQNLQPGIAPQTPILTIVGGCYVNSGEGVTTWDTIYAGDAIGAEPTHVRVGSIASPFVGASAGNFNWDGQQIPWRAWLVLHQAPVEVSSGTGAATTTAAAGSYKSPGQNVNGVWVPATSGTPVNSPWITITGVTVGNVGQWLLVSGSANAANNGAFPIVQASPLVIANPNGVAGDAGPLTWEIVEYPWLAPGPVWGAPSFTDANGKTWTPPTFGNGQLAPAPIDTGSNIGGVWQPSTQGSAVASATLSWGLNLAADVIQSIRALVKTWKSGGTYYPNIIIAFDGITQVAGSAYSPNSTPGSGNPDGSFGSHGKNIGGVWVPTRTISSLFDCYCQGTGTHQACSVENLS